MEFFLTLTLSAAGIILGSVILATGIERIMRLLNVRPEVPDDRSGGFRDVLSRIGQWQHEETSRREK